MTWTPVEPGWLALRGPADSAARTAAGGSLVADLGRFLRRRTVRTHRTPRLVDVGAGTGAGALWLRSRLPAPQDWRLIDVDAGLLAQAVPVRAGWARPIVADLTALDELLAAEPADAVTCQALLDLLTPAQVDALLLPASGSSAAVLLSLTVTGAVHLTPADLDDRLVADAFDEHQQRDGRLGPGAAGYAAMVLRRHGYVVTDVPAPWHLGRDHRDLLAAYLSGRAAAAAEQRPGEATRIARWLQSRLAAVRTGSLTAVVGHVEVLGIYPSNG